MRPFIAVLILTASAAIAIMAVLYAGRADMLESGMSVETFFLSLA